MFPVFKNKIKVISQSNIKKWEVAEQKGLNKKTQIFKWAGSVQLFSSSSST
jgi:hypothetical protein